MYFRYSTILLLSKIELWMTSSITTYPRSILLKEIAKVFPFLLELLDLLSGPDWLCYVVVLLPNAFSSSSSVAKHINGVPSSSLARKNSSHPSLAKRKLSILDM